MTGWVGGQLDEYKLALNNECTLNEGTHASNMQEQFARALGRMIDDH